MTEDQLELGIPQVAEEPKPWEVSVWHYKHETRIPCLTREDAIEEAKSYIEADNCYVEAIFDPSGQPDEEAMYAAAPWRRPKEPGYYGPPK